MVSPLTQNTQEYHYIIDTLGEKINLQKERRQKNMKEQDHCGKMKKKSLSKAPRKASAVTRILLIKPYINTLNTRRESFYNVVLEI